MEHDIFLERVVNNSGAKALSTLNFVLSYLLHMFIEIEASWWKDLKILHTIHANLSLFL